MMMAEMVKTISEQSGACEVNDDDDGNAALASWKQATKTVMINRRQKMMMLMIMIMIMIMMMLMMMMMMMMMATAMAINATTL